MAKTKMVNFRFKENELTQIDAAAKRAGQTRSEWIRSTLHAAMGSTPVQIKSAVQPKTCVNGNAVACQEPSTRALTGVKTCDTCGVKKA